MKKLLLNTARLIAPLVLLGILFNSNFLSAQSTANYSFTTAATGSLASDLNSNTVDMTTGTTSLLTTTSSDDVASGVTSIGFDFYLMGNQYTDFSVSSNGGIMLGSTAITSTLYQASGGTTASPVISAFTADLAISATALSGVRSKVIGTAPNRCLVIEFKGMTLYYSSNYTNDGTWQVRLYETTGAVEFVYGDMKVTSSTGPGTVSDKTTGIGFSTNTTATNFIYVTSSTNTATTTGTFTDNATYANAVITNLNSASNGSRRFYRFSQTAPAAPTSLTFSAIGSTGMTLNWTDNATNELGYLLYYSTDNVTYTVLGQLAANSNGAVVTGLNPGTLYYYKVYALREGALSSALSGSQATKGGVAFTTSGSFTVPCYVTSLTVEAWGGGGKGGDRTTGNNVALAGGGGGAYSSSVLTSPFTSPYTVTVGAGSTTTAAGGDSWFGSTTTVLAKGGASVADNSNTRGAGGLASAGFGTTKFNGGTGAAGSGGVYGGGGGSSAGSAAAGNFTNATTTQNAGGLAPTDGGNGGVGAVSGVAGVNGTFPGGGGGGGFRTTGASTQLAGDGAGGQVVVSWTCPAATIAYTGGPFCKSLSSATVTITGTDARSTCSNTFSSTPAGLSINTTTGAINPSASTVGTYTVSYQLAAAGGCSAVNATVSVTIIDVPTIASITAPAALCSGGSLNPTAPTVTANGSTVSSQGWQLETAVGSGTFASLTVPYTVAFADNGKKIRYTATNGCGTTNGNQVTLTVNDVPTIASITAPAALCSGGSLNPTAPTVTANGSTVSSQGWQLETAVGSGTFASLTVPYTVAFADNGKKIRYTATNGCGTTNGNQVTLTVNDVPTIASITAPAALCSGGSLNPTAPTVTANGSTVSSQGWQLETAVGSGTFASLTVPYTVAFADNGKKIRYTATNGCGTTNSNQVTLTINNVPTIASISAPAALCSGGSLNPTAPTVTANGSTVSSQGWQLETAVGSGTFASLTVPYTVAFADNGKKIRYTATNGCGTTNGNQVTLTINNVPTIASISAPAALCSGGSLNPTAPTVTANGSTLSSQGWQLETAVGSGTFASLTVPYTVAFADNGKKIRYTATNGCGTTNGNQVTLTVNDVPTIASISAPAALCSGGSLNPTAPTVTANGSTVSSQGWQLETAVGSGTFATLTVPYTVAFADNGKKIRYTATNGCGTTNSNQVTLTVNDVPTIASISAPAALCSGGSLNPTAPTVTANGSTVSSQGWQLETAVGSGTFATLTVPYIVAFADNGKKIRYTATNGCGTTNSNQVTLTVNNVPTIASISAPAALCSGGSLNPTAPTVTANGSTVSSQGWQLETAVGSGTFASLTVPYTVAFTDNGKKIRYTATNGCGTTNGNQVTLTVNDVPTIASISAPVALCSGGSLNPTAPTVTANGSMVSSQGWQLETAVGSGTFATLTVPYIVAFADNGKKIRYTATNGCGTTNGNQVTLTVNDVPTIASISAPAALCSGGSLNPTVPTVTANGSTVSLQGWQLETAVGSGTFASLTVPYTVAFADNGKKIRYTATNGCGTTNGNQVTLTVNDVPTIASISAPAALCSGGSLNPTAPTVTANGSTVSSQGWQLETAVGSGTFASLTVPYTVAFADNGKKIRYTATNGCGTTNGNQVTLTVNPASTAAVISGNAGICSGSSTNLQVAITNGASPFTLVYTDGSSNFTVSPYTSGSNISVTPSSTTTYTLVSVTSTGGCAGTGNSGSAVVTLASTSTSNGITWTNGTPTGTKDVIFTGNATIGANLNACSLKVTNSAVVSVTSGFNVDLNGAMIVDSGSSFTVNNNANLVQHGSNYTNSGNIIVKRNSSALKRLDYTLWSSPVTGQGIYAFSPFTFANRFYSYISSTNAYNNAAIGFSITGLNTDGVNGTDSNNVQFSTGKGYLIRVPWDHPTSASVWNGSFTGVPHNGDISVPVSLLGEPTIGYGYNAIGNPYPSTISVQDFISQNTNISGTLYFWRKTNNASADSYATLTSTAYVANGYPGGDTGTGYFNTGNESNWVLNVGQGFFVKATSGSNINFTNGMRRSSNANQFFKTSQASVSSITNGLYWLNLNANTGVYSQMAVGYSPQGTLAADRGIDGENINHEFYITSLIGTGEYSVQGRPDFQPSDVVPLSYKVTSAGSYTISIDHTAGLFDDIQQSIYLKDNLTNTEYDLRSGAYSFTSAVGTFANRFEIIYQTQLGNPTFTANTVVIYTQNNDFVINTGDFTMSDVKVFDIRGRLLQERKGINANHTTISGGLANEVMLVQITSEDGVVVTKKVVR